MIEHSHIDTQEKVSLGFWIYLMSDCVLFAALFAAYAVLHAQTFSGPSGHDIFSLRFVFIETLLLLTSSFTAGVAFIAAKSERRNLALMLLATTFLLGAGFVSMEVFEFHSLLAEGHGPGMSAFLSSYFTLVGTHGLHVTLGLLWLLVLAVHLYVRGTSEGTLRKLFCFTLFWHFLDLVWICIFTFVYLFGIL